MMRVVSFTTNTHELFAPTVAVVDNLRCLSPYRAALEPGCHKSVPQITQITSCAEKLMYILLF